MFSGLRVTPMPSSPIVQALKEWIIQFVNQAQSESDAGFHYLKIKAEQGRDHRKWLAARLEWSLEWDDLYERWRGRIAIYDETQIVFQPRSALIMSVIRPLLVRSMRVSCHWQVPVSQVMRNSRNSGLVLHGVTDGGSGRIFIFFFSYPASHWQKQDSLAIEGKITRVW